MSGSRHTIRVSHTAFTLIELLVVISIIALLLSIMTPALGKAKKSAQAVLCSSNLRTWGQIFSIYAAENNGKFPTWGDTNATSGYVFTEMAKFQYGRDFNDNKMLLCPTARKLPQVGDNTHMTHELGGQGYAWMLNPAMMATSEFGSHSSYGENLWIRKMAFPSILNDPAQSQYYDERTWQRMDTMKNANKVPLLLDARWQGAWADNIRTSQLKVPAKETRFYNSQNWSAINCFVMRRHKDGVNIVFGDGSAGPVQAEDLWKLKWNKLSKEVDIENDLSWLKF